MPARHARSAKEWQGLALSTFFKEKGRKVDNEGNFCVIVAVPSDTYRRLFSKKVYRLKPSIHKAVAVLAQDWEQYVERGSQNVTQKFCQSREEKKAKQRELR